MVLDQTKNFSKNFFKNNLNNISHSRDSSRILLLDSISPLPEIGRVLRISSSNQAGQVVTIQTSEIKSEKVIELLSTLS